MTPSVRLGPVAVSGGVALYDCPCGCGMPTSEPARLCGCCGKHRSGAHWDGLYDMCSGCAWCHSLEHEACDHGACYAPIAAAQAREDGDPDAPGPWSAQHRFDDLNAALGRIRAVVRGVL